MAHSFKYLLLFIWLIFSEFLITVHTTSGEIRTDSDRQRLSFALFIPEDALSYIEVRDLNRDWDVITGYPVWKPMIRSIQDDAVSGDIRSPVQFLESFFGWSRKEFLNLAGHNFAFASFLDDDYREIKFLFLAEVGNREMAEESLNDVFNDSTATFQDDLSASRQEQPVRGKMDSEGDILFHYQFFKNCVIIETGQTCAHLKACLQRMGAQGQASLADHLPYRSIQKILPPGGANRGYIDLKKFRRLLETCADREASFLSAMIKSLVLDNMTGWDTVGFRREFQENMILHDIAGLYRKEAMKQTIRQMLSVPPDADPLFSAIPASARAAESVRIDPAAYWRLSMESVRSICEVMARFFPLSFQPPGALAEENFVHRIPGAFGSSIGFALLSPDRSEPAAHPFGIPIFVLTVEEREKAEDMLNALCRTLTGSIDNDISGDFPEPYFHSEYDGVEIKALSCRFIVPVTFYYAFREDLLMISLQAEGIEQVVSTSENERISLDQVFLQDSDILQPPAGTSERFYSNGEILKNILRLLVGFIALAGGPDQVMPEALPAMDAMTCLRGAAESAGAIESLAGWLRFENYTWRCRIVLRF